VWFRQDLRLADHEALHAAAKSGAPVLPLYIHDDETPGALHIGGASRWWLHQSLEALSASLAKQGGTLILRKGPAHQVLADLLDETDAAAIHATRIYEPFGTQCEEDAAALCQNKGVAFQLHPGRLLFAPKDVATKDGRPFRVFTPFWRACLARPSPPAPLSAPTMRAFAEARSRPLHELNLQPTKPDWAGGLRDFWRPGEKHAQDRLTHFLDQLLGAYADRRDDLFGDSTSRLSPHLHFGEISPRQIWHRSLHAANAQSGTAPRGVEVFLKELGWREFSYHLLHQFPHMPDEPLRPEFEHFPWRQDPDALTAWQRGQTGYPVVDAGMRQLWLTGWMPNRVRMIAHRFSSSIYCSPGRTGRRGSGTRWPMRTWPAIQPAGSGLPDVAPTPRHISASSTPCFRARSSTLTASMCATGCRNWPICPRAIFTRPGKPPGERPPSPVSILARLAARIPPRSWITAPQERGHLPRWQH